MKDAWKKHDNLWKRFRKETEIRKDIIVVANGIERGVHLQVGEYDENQEQILDRPGKASGGYRYNDTGPRNISTMREVALALLEACDFVEESNPTWARLHDGDLAKKATRAVRELVKSRELPPIIRLPE
jgi:hypothetical protein